MKVKLILLTMLVGFVSQVQASLIVSDNDSVIINSGDSYDRIYIEDNATVNMIGGTLALGTQYVSYMYDNSEFTVSGGTISGLIILHDDSQIILSGSDFYVGDVAVDLGELNLDALAGLGALSYSSTEFNEYNGTISGILSDGNNFSIDFQIMQFRLGSEPETANITLVPEPLSMSLLGLGGIFICRKMKK